MAWRPSPSRFQKLPLPVSPEWGLVVSPGREIFSISTWRFPVPSASRPPDLGLLSFGHATGAWDSPSVAPHSRSSGGSPSRPAGSRGFTSQSAKPISSSPSSPSSGSSRGYTSQPISSPSSGSSRGYTTQPISSPSAVLVVQPRLKPEALLKSRLSEALRLVEALHRRGQTQTPMERDSPPTSRTQGDHMRPDQQGQPIRSHSDSQWWPAGVPDSSSPWVVVGQARASSSSRASSTSSSRSSTAQRHSNPRASSSPFLGKGAVETVAAHVRAVDSSSEGAPLEAVFVNAPLSGTQQRMLEAAWGKRVVDRVGLIIGIFGAHAATREAKLQVELASLAYQRSRLVRVRTAETGARKGFGPQAAWEVVSAKGRGGAGGRGFLSGAGESELALQRTRIVEKEHRLRGMLADVRRTRELHRAHRRRSSAGWGGRGTGLPVVAVVGYTNAGKSSLVSALSGEQQFCDDSLFATLDPRMRGVRLPSGRRVLLSDTVGFVSELPTELIEAFHATLEEVVEADLLLHVIDGSAGDRGVQRDAVCQVLESLGVDASGGVGGEAGGRDAQRDGTRGVLTGTWQTGRSSPMRSPMLPVIEVWNKVDLWGQADENLDQPPLADQASSTDQPPLADQASSTDQPPSTDQPSSTDESSSKPSQSNSHVWTTPPSWEQLAFKHAVGAKRELRILPRDADESVDAGPQCVRVETSAVSGCGLEELLQVIDETLWKRGF